MVKKDLQPPADGLNRNPILHGVASGLAKLFPPVEQPAARAPAGAPPRAAGRPGRD